MIERLVESTERLYRALFTTAVAFAPATAVWALVIAPFNPYDHVIGRTVAIGVVLLAVLAVTFRRRAALLRLLQTHPEFLLGFVALGVLTLWADTGWRSSFYVFSYLALPLAAVAANVRWSMFCALILALGYASGLALHGYTWQRLHVLNDQDGVVSAMTGYFVAGYFFSAPVAWLGGYIVRINQILGDKPATSDQRTRTRTKGLSVREVQVTQLVAAGYSNEEIAGRLIVSGRTVQSHVASALRKTKARNRAELGVLAVREGLVPLTETMTASQSSDGSKEPVGTL